MSLVSTFSPRPAPVYVLLHAAEPHRRGAYDLVHEACVPSLGLPAFNHGTFRAPENGEDALAAARTLPMMADTRLVVVRDIEEGTNAFFGSLMEYLKEPNPSTVLVLIGAGYPKVVKGGKRWSTAVEKAVKEAGGWVLDRKAKIDAPRYAAEQAQARGKQLQPAAARFLVEMVGDDLGRLEQEIEKLSLYVGDAPGITTTDVDAVCALVAEAVIWDLTSALVKGDRAGTLQHLQRLLSDGLDPRQVLFTITWKLRSVTAAADAIRHGANDAQAAKAGGMRAYEVRVVRSAVEKGLPSAERMLGSLAESNRLMNSHRAGAHRILERLVLDLVP